jgi:hypothetical protein
MSFPVTARLTAVHRIAAEEVTLWQMEAAHAAVAPAVTVAAPARTRGTRDSGNYPLSPFPFCGQGRSRFAALWRG